jgi:hypothetical protein
MVSAFNAQGSRVIIVVLLFGVLEIYVATVEALRQKKDRMNLSLPPILIGKLVWVPFIFIPNYVFDALLPVFYFFHFCIVA